MPIIRPEIPEVDTRVSRLIIKQVMEDIVTRFKDLPFKEFRYMGDGEALMTPGSTLGESKDNRSQSDSYIEVDATDEPDENFSKSFLCETWNNHFIFRCKRTLLDIFPVYQNRKITVTFKIVAGSRVRCNALQTRIIEAMRKNQTLFTHQVSYNFDMPVSIETLIQMFYVYMQTNHPYPDLPFDKWFDECSDENLEYATTQNGVAKVMMYKQNAVGITSNLTEHDSEPRKDKDNDNGQFFIELEMEIWYQRPSSIRASYPPIVHNRFIPDIWYNFKNQFEYSEFFSTSSVANQALERFKWNIGTGNPSFKTTGFKEPIFDDWGINLTNANLVKLVTALVVIDETQLNYFFDIDNDLVEYRFPKEVIALMKVKAGAMLYDDSHFFSIKCYDKDGQIPPEYIRIDENLKVTTTFDLSPRNYYHIVISVNQDPSVIDGLVIENAVCEPDGLASYFSVLGTKYGNILEEILAQIRDSPDEKICISQNIIRDVVREMVIDGLPLDNGLKFYDPSPWRLRLNYSVHGEVIGNAGI